MRLPFLCLFGILSTQDLESDLLPLCPASSEPEWMSHFELLVRSILVRPDQPAVIVLGHFAPQVQAQHGYVGPELLHTIVSQYYDVPHIRFVFQTLSLSKLFLARNARTERLT